uniref:Uncharacterized protein n=1 Tax=Setaria italica TaxID=4555 RepID=K4APA7_SETIT
MVSHSHFVNIKDDSPIHFLDVRRPIRNLSINKKILKICN